jgi:hypothetical protein
MKVKNATCSECCETLQSRFGMVPGHLYSCWHLLHLFLWQPLPPCAQHILGVLCVTRGAELYWPATHPCQHLSGAAAEYDTVCHVFTQKPTLGALWSTMRYAMQAPLAGPNQLNSWSDIFLSQCRHNTYAYWLIASISASQGFSWRA